jgi:hypothetical protein
MRRVAAVVGLGLLLSLAAAAQVHGENRSVTGQVTDENGRPVRGAAVKLRDTVTFTVRSFITRRDGTYEFRGLSTHVDYELEAEYHGVKSKTERLSKFDSRKRAVVNLRIPVAT